MTAPTWVPINDYPGDQRYDGVPGTKDVSFYGEIGPAETGWSWTIIAMDYEGDQWDADDGRCYTEAEAKAAVESWRPTVDIVGQACYTESMTTTTIDIMNTVALTLISPRGARLVQFTTNDGRIGVTKDLDGTWAVGPIGGNRPFVAGLDSLEAAVDFILGARALMAPADS